MGPNMVPKLPQGLKPKRLLALLCGTAKAVPFQTIYEIASKYCVLPNLQALSRHHPHYDSQTGQHGDEVGSRQRGRLWRDIFGEQPPCRTCRHSKEDGFMQSPSQ